MTRFTDSPYERMMTRRPEGGKEISRPPSLPHNHPCYGCGNYGSPCVGICHREMERWLKEGNEKMSVLIIFIKLIAVFDLLVIAVYFGGDILSTHVKQTSEKAKAR